ncbi:MAG: molybdopterin-synthase adenylyltransferase MoeB [Gammaproteobacteria bacterium]|nr:molybdopterin-synthase adenylyltransferase MoeB [Gammaproteobacteria bacterium]
MLSKEQLERYSRQVVLPGIGESGQRRLLEAKVLIVGLGGLGSPVALYLAAAGVGQLVLADFDRVNIPDLQRQIIHRMETVGELKVQSALLALKSLNPAVEVTLLSGQNLEELECALKQVDVIVDCTDNFGARFSLNRMSVYHKKPLVSGAAIRMDGQVTVFDPRDPKSPCYQCLYPEVFAVQDTCQMSGILGSVAGIVGSIQATETLKLLLGIGQTLKGKLLLLNALTMVFREVSVIKDPLCPLCSCQEGFYNP